jgi:hypothetical protein
MTSLRTKILIGIALAAFAAGLCGAIARGFWGVSQDCHEWAQTHGYQVVRNEWFAKSRGCVAVNPAGDELVHSEDLQSKATGWAWQFAIFAAGAAPAATLITLSARRFRRNPDR